MNMPAYIIFKIGKLYCVSYEGSEHVIQFKSTQRADARNWIAFNSVTHEEATQ